MSLSNMRQGEHPDSWRLPIVKDMVHPMEEVTKNPLVGFVALLVWRLFTMAPIARACGNVEFGGILFLAVFWIALCACVGHDLLRLKRRVLGSTRRKLAIARLVIGIPLLGLLPMAQWRSARQSDMLERQTPALLESDDRVGE